MIHKYRFEIEALSPVHIGTGEVYEPTNFVIDDGYLYEFDEVLFVKGLPQAQRDAFNRIIGREDYFQIIDFYKQHRDYAKLIAHHKTPVSKKVEDKYHTFINKDGSKNRNQLEIQKTYKNPNSHRPVIPGSSIKGVFDTVFGIYPQKIKENEPRQALKVSDALMVEGGSRIGYSYRRHKDPSKSAKNPIPQMVEIVAHGTKFIATVETPLSFDVIIKKFEAYYNQPERENGYFRATSTSFVARVGKFSGKPFMVDDGHRVRNSYGKKVATHTLYEDNSPFGWIVFRRIEEEVYRQKLEKVETESKAYLQTLRKRQKVIIERFEKQKAEAKKRREEREAQALAEQKAKEEALAQMSPLERKIEELKVTCADPNATVDIILFNAIKNGELDDFKCEALKLLKEEMQKAKKWVEQSKKPEKDKKYKRTQEVIGMLSEC